MGIAMTIAEIKIGFKFTNKQKDQIRKIAPKLYKKLNKEYQRIFGRDTSIEDHFNPGSLISKLRDAKKQPSSQYSDDITALYQNAFNQKYQDVKGLYEGTFKQKELEKHQNRKRIRASKGRTTDYGKRMNFTTPALLSGYFRETVSYGLGVGGGSSISTSNLLLYGAYGVNLDFYPNSKNGKSYVVNFLDTLQRKGVIDDYEDFFRFRPEETQRIANFLKMIVQKDLIPSFKKVISNFSEDV